MSSNVVLNGVTYSIPADGDNNWGPDLTAFFISIASNVLQKTGGTFTLTAEAAFGATYGLKSAYIKSYATNPASAGAIRLGNTESISWRNNANSADLALTSNASDALLFNSKNVLFSGLALIVNADVSASAAIAYSKLNLTGLIVSADLAGSIDATKIADGSVTSTEFQYINTLSSNAQTQINAKAPSASPTFTGTVTVPATITGASAQVLTLPTTTGNLALNPMTTGGDLIYGGASGTGTRLANGSAGQYLQSNGTTVAPTWVTGPRSEVFVDTGNGHGSGSTKVRRFTNARLNTGTAITYAVDSTLGSTFTINETGVYAIFYVDYKVAGSTFIGITVNASSLTTSITSLTYANGRRHGTNTAGASATGQASWTGILTATDVVRAMTDGTPDSADAFCSFSIVKVSV